MIRSIPVLLLLVLLAAPSLAEDALFPLGEGSKWTFDSRTTTGAMGFGVEVRGTVTAVVEKIETIEGVSCHAIHWIDEEGDLDSTTWVWTEGDSVRVARSTDGHLLLLPTDVAAGGEHATVRVGGTSCELSDHAVGESETVEVPAGRYEALPVRCTVKTAGVTIQTTVWYARGVGPVKIAESVVVGGAAETKRVLSLRAHEHR
ncbi:MAG: hypothetical protein HY720_01725 [Planctomycetes bacterium]|nr:hypothetical protein [Planctomycetota bacterium]